MFNLDWHGIFAPSVPFLEIVLRGSIVYLVLFILLRLTFRRIGGTIGLGDVLMIALVAAAAQNAIAREHHSITEDELMTHLRRAGAPDSTSHPRIHSAK